MQAFMVNVQLPTRKWDEAVALQETLDLEYDTYIVVTKVLGDEELIYTRLSCQVYLQKSDFSRLGRLVQQLLPSASGWKAASRGEDLDGGGGGKLLEV
eukprot:8333827-Pyramimonas_sp.AAC.2